MRKLRPFLLVLAVLLNVSGTPMAFAHSASSHSSDAAAAAQAGEHCADHASAPAEEPSGDSELPCCAGGDCVCAGASSFAMGASSLVQFVRYVRADDLRLAEPLSVSLRDPIRPPIV